MQTARPPIQCAPIDNYAGAFGAAEAHVRWLRQAYESASTPAGKDGAVEMFLDRFERVAAELDRKIAQERVEREARLADAIRGKRA